MSQFEMTQELALLLTDVLPVGVCLAATNGEIVYANTKIENIFGYDKNELTGYYIEDLIPANYRHAHHEQRQSYVSKPVGTAMAGGRLLAGLNKYGEEIQLQVGLSPFSDEYTLVSIIETTNNIMKPSSANDLLTGLPNRKMFDEYSHKLRTLAIRNNKNISIAFIDLDHFKPINDEFGHQFGDKVIRKVASLLKEHMRESDIVARIGGDEFIVCLYGVNESNHLKAILTKLINRITSIEHIDGNKINLGASIGALLSISPKDIDISEMVHQTDKLMYEAKKAGKGVVIVNEIHAS